MIKLNRVTKLVGRKNHRRVVLNELDWTIAPRTQLALLSVHPADCTTFLDIVSGTQLPTSGWVDRRSTVLSASRIARTIAGMITPRRLITNLATVYRVDPEVLIDFINDFAELGDLMTVPIRYLPRSVQHRLGSALIYGLPSDFYLFDQRVQPGPPEMRERCRMAFDGRREQAGMILATSQTRFAREFGGAAGILHHGAVYLTTDPEDAMAAFERLLLEDKKNKDKDKQATFRELPEGAPNSADPGNIDFMM